MAFTIKKNTTRSQEFKGWLQAKGCYNQFCSNLFMQKRLTFNDFLLKVYIGPNAIDSALSWGGTPEGHGFWSNLNHQWALYYKTGKILPNKGCKSIW